MSVKALILDLDNTIYPVPSIGEELFKPVFDVLQNSSDYEGDLEDIKQDMMRIPFQKVAAKYKFSKSLEEKVDSVFRNLTYEKEFPPFEDYAHLRKMPHQKFLVTTGYTKMQQSKVDQLGLEKDFEEIHIVDPSKTKQTKKDVFKSILERYTLSTSEVWVVGDDPESEIKAGKELGLTTVLYSKNGNHTTHATHAISHFKELGKLLANK